VRRSPNLRFILTTREYILADAQRVHGAFAAHAREILKYTLRLEDYSKSHRAKMLFNHLYFSDLPDSRLARLVQDRIYAKIVEHTHFSPRIVETISNYANSRAMSDDQYVDFIQREFDNPARVWEQPFRSDISPEARELLMVLWTFGGTAELETLKSAVKRGSTHANDGEYFFRISDALRQLDGNFIATNRYPGRSKKEGPYLVVQFNNASVEEFVDNFLRSDPSLIERLTRSVVCFDQVRELAAQTSGERKLRSLSLAFWQSLREVAALVEGSPAGHLINFHPSGEAVRRTWDPGEQDLPRQTMVRLEIESEANRKDELFSNLQARVTTSDGWVGLIRGIQHDNSHAYGVQHLHEWVIGESGWSKKAKADCRSAFRQAVTQIIGDEDQVWACSIGSLRILAETMATDGTPFTKEERAAFLEACKLAAGTIVDNDDDPDDVRGEADELTKMEKICGLVLKKEIAKLKACADDLVERPSYQGDIDPESDYMARSALDSGFDADALFAGLLDR
jgi:hypothetical protein